MAFWYIAHDDELLIDLDDASRRTRTGGPWIEIFFRRRLRDAIAGGVLNVADVFLALSNTSKHYHAIVRLSAPMPTIERLTWQLHLGSDLYRGRADLMRAARGTEFPSLLIRSQPIPSFYRAPDFQCACVEKHVTSENPTCDVWRRVRGASPWELFGPSSPLQLEYGVPLSPGRVPMDRIMMRRLPEATTEHGKENEQTAQHDTTEREPGSDG